MGYSRLKKKTQRIKAKSARRKTNLKNWNFQPVVKSVDIEKIKEEFEHYVNKKKV